MIYTTLFLIGLISGFTAGIVGVGTGFIMIAVIPITLDYLQIPSDLVVKLTIANTIFARMCSSLVYRSLNKMTF